jgi:hypothetical protein
LPTSKITVVIIIDPSYSQYVNEDSVNLIIIGAIKAHLRRITACMPPSWAWQGIVKFQMLKLIHELVLDELTNKTFTCYHSGPGYCDAGLSSEVPNYSYSLLTINQVSTYESYRHERSALRNGLSAESPSKASEPYIAESKQANLRTRGKIAEYWD